MSPEGFEPPTFRSLYYQALATLSNQDVFIALIFYTAVTNMLTAVDESVGDFDLNLVSDSV